MRKTLSLLLCITLLGNETAMALQPAIFAAAFRNRTDRFAQEAMTERSSFIPLERQRHVVYLAAYSLLLSFSRLMGQQVPAPLPTLLHPTVIHSQPLPNGGIKKELRIGYGYGTYTRMAHPMDFLTVLHTYKTSIKGSKRLREVVRAVGQDAFVFQALQQFFEEGGTIVGQEGETHSSSNPLVIFVPDSDPKAENLFFQELTRYALSTLKNHSDDGEILDAFQQRFLIIRAIRRSHEEIPKTAKDPFNTEILRAAQLIGQDIEAFDQFLQKFVVAMDKTPGASPEQVGTGILKPLPRSPKKAANLPFRVLPVFYGQPAPVTPNSFTEETVTHKDGTTWTWPARLNGDYRATESILRIVSHPRRKAPQGGFQKNLRIWHSYGTYTTLVAPAEINALLERYKNRFKGAPIQIEVVRRVIADTYVFEAFRQFLADGGSVVEQEVLGHYTPSPLQLNVPTFDPDASDRILFHELLHYIFDKMDAALSDAPNAGLIDHILITPLEQRFMLIHMARRGRSPWTDRKNDVLFGYGAGTSVGVRIQELIDEGDWRDLLNYVNTDLRFYQAYVHSGMITPLSASQYQKQHKSDYSLSTADLQDLAHLEAYNAQLLRGSIAIGSVLATRNARPIADVVPTPAYQTLFNRFREQFAEAMERNPQAALRQTATDILDSLLRAENLATYPTSPLPDKRSDYRIADVGWWLSLLGFRRARTRASRFEMAPDTPFLSDQERRLAEIASFGVQLTGATQIPSTYLDDIVVILRRAGPAYVTSRQATLLPWYLLPASWLVNLPLLPIESGSFVPALPYRQSFRFLFAIDTASTIVRDHPELAAALGQTTEQAVAVLAQWLSAEDPRHDAELASVETVLHPDRATEPWPVSQNFSSGRTFASSAVLGVSILSYLWLGLAYMSGWGPTIVSAPFKITLLIASVIFWVMLALRPISRLAVWAWHQSVNNPRALKPRVAQKLLPLLLRIPKLVLIPVIVATFLVYVPGDASFQIHWPRPFAPLSDFVREWRNGTDRPLTTNKPLRAKRVTPLFFPGPTFQKPRLLVPAGPKPDIRQVQPIEPDQIAAQDPKPTPEFSNQPKDDSPLAQSPTVTEPPVPPTGNPAGIVKDVRMLVSLSKFDGNYSELRDVLVKMSDIDETTRTRLLTEFQNQFDAARLASTTRLILVVKDQKQYRSIEEVRAYDPTKDQNPPPQKQQENFTPGTLLAASAVLGRWRSKMPGEEEAAKLLVEVRSMPETPSLANTKMPLMNRLYSELMTFTHTLTGVHRGFDFYEIAILATRIASLAPDNGLEDNVQSALKRQLAAEYGELAGAGLHHTAQAEVITQMSAGAFLAIYKSPKPPTPEKILVATRHALAIDAEQKHVQKKQETPSIEAPAIPNPENKKAEDLLKEARKLKPNSLISNDRKALKDQLRNDLIANLKPFDQFWGSASIFSLATALATRVAIAITSGVLSPPLKEALVQNLTGEIHRLAKETELGPEYIRKLLLRLSADRVISRWISPDLAKLAKVYRAEAILKEAMQQLQGPAAGILIGLAVGWIALHALQANPSDFLQAGAGIGFLLPKLSRRNFLRTGGLALAGAAALLRMKTRGRISKPESRAIQKTIERLSLLKDRRAGSQGARQALEIVREELLRYGYSRGQIIQGDVEGMQTFVGVIKKGNPNARKLVVMSHLDSWAMRGREAPGADDNASGTAAVLEIARLLAGNAYDGDISIIFTLDEERVRLGGSQAMTLLAKEGFTPENTWILNVDGIGQSTNKQDPKIVLTDHAGDFSPDFAGADFLRMHPIFPAIPVTTKAEKDPVTSKGVLDASQISALYGYPATSVQAPDDNNSPFHSALDRYSHIPAVTAVATWLLEAAERYAVYRYTVKDPVSADRPVQLPADRQVYATQAEVEALFGRFGITFKTDGSWPVSQETYHSLEEWLTFVSQRWPSFSQHFHTFLNTATPPAVIPSDTLIFTAPLDQTIVRDIAWMNETYGVYYATRNEFLTRQLAQRMLAQMSPAEKGPSFLPPGAKALNEAQISLGDFASLFLWGHVMDETFMGRVRAEDEEMARIKLVTAARRETYWYKQFKNWGIRPFQSPFNAAKFNHGKYLMPVRRARSAASRILAMLISPLGLFVPKETVENFREKRSPLTMKELDTLEIIVTQTSAVSVKSIAKATEIGQSTIETRLSALVNKIFGWGTFQNQPKRVTSHMLWIVWLRQHFRAVREYNAGLPATHQARLTAQAA